MVAVVPQGEAKRLADCLNGELIVIPHSCAIFGIVTQYHDGGEPVQAYLELGPNPNNDNDFPCIRNIDGSTTHIFSLGFDYEFKINLEQFSEIPSNREPSTGIAIIGSEKYLRFNFSHNRNFQAGFLNLDTFIIGSANPMLGRVYSPGIQLFIQNHDALDANRTRLFQIP